MLASTRSIPLNPPSCGRGKQVGRPYAPARECFAAPTGGRDSDYSIRRWRGHFRRLVEIADAAHQQRDGFTFGFGKVGVPGVQDHHRAHLVAAVPRFVLEGVVEGDAAAFLPRMFDTADA